MRGHQILSSFHNANGGAFNAVDSVTRNIVADLSQPHEKHDLRTFNTVIDVLGLEFAVAFTPLFNNGKSFTLESNILALASWLGDGTVLRKITDAHS